MIIDNSPRTIENLENSATQAAPLKIGYIWQYEAANLEPFSATALHVQAVVRHLQKHGHTVRMVTIREGVPCWSEDLEHWQAIDTGRANAGGISGFERGVRKLQALLDLPYLRLFDSYRFSLACTQALAGYDIAYERFWLLASGGLMAMRRMGSPLVYEVNGDLVEEYYQLGIKLSKAQWSAIHLVTRQMFLRAARVVTVSETLRQRTIERWKLPAAKVITVDNGANVDLFHRAATSAPVLSEIGVDDHVQIIFVGSFQPWHGLDLLVDAFAALPQRDHPARLVLVGDGPVRAELEEQVQRLALQDRVLFTGNIPHSDVPALLSNAQIAVINPRQSPASLSQSPLKLFEYMAAGTAIVAPRLPNIERILTHRKNALLFPPGDALALAAALMELISDKQLRCSLGEAAQAQALSSHSWDQTVEKLETIFREELVRSR